MPKVKIEVGRKTYEGKTQKEATAKALEHLALFNDGRGCTPAIVSVPGDVTDADGNAHPGVVTGIVYRDGDGRWAYTIHRVIPGSVKKVPYACGTGMTSDRTWASTVRTLKYTLAQASYGHLSQEDALKLADPEDYNDLAAWWGTQDAYCIGREP